ncbi:MAG: hypothetical protein AAF730_10915 [Bacteroidota bacterium]
MPTETMWKNYLTVALRNMNRRKGYAAINIAGLALGFGVGILFLVLGRTLLTYDTFHDDVDDIYQSYLQYGDRWGTFSMWGAAARRLRGRVSGHAGQHAPLHQRAGDSRGRRH